MPQFVTLVASVTSQPLAAAPSQLECPGMHAKPQVLDAHDPVAKGGEAHVTLQPPQFNGSAVVAVSQPSANVPLQFEKPVEQLVMAHAPVVQVTDAFGAAHALWHAPQLPTSLIRFASQPLAAAPSQSWNVPLQ